MDVVNMLSWAFDLTEKYNLYTTYSNIFQVKLPEMNSTMSTAVQSNQANICYKLPVINPIISPAPFTRVTCNRPCNGYNRGLCSSNPCNDFINVPDISRAISMGFSTQEISNAVSNETCAYELNARKGRVNTHVTSLGKNCSPCNSNSKSELTCDYYIHPMDYFRGICGFNIRAKKLTKKFGGEEYLHSSEVYCLKCPSTLETAKCEGGKGYRDVAHIVHDLCHDKARVLDKKRRKLPLTDLELNCHDCPSQPNNRRCEKPGFWTEFDTWAASLHTLSAKPAQQITLAV